MKLGDLLKCYMAMREVSCRDLAKEVGTSAATISRIANGEEPSAATLVLLINWMMK